MNIEERKGIVTQIIDKETVKVSVINEEQPRIVKGTDFYIKELKDIFENEENESEGIVLVKFNNKTNTIIETIEEGDF
ncbi:hypothetical protein [uncultured Clostridium sp.]|uniref:hypothetical protein n=1 Tax=uncultured Clostridium sp. TaxID=59620 RepID=UPI002623B67A|nr:hypothetical protein [uncultured Clostridium sp.]